ncbi:MAG: hypothetical protein H0U74_05625 [Bradymonadaceae bacterium]|nr:hypothetical protein [Lujinxingiaceae bacterium]
MRTIPIGFDLDVAVESSILSFRLHGTNRLVAEQAVVHIVGVSGTGGAIDSSFVVEAKREGDVGDMYLELPVRHIWSLFNPAPRDRFSGRFEIELVDSIGVLGRGHVEQVTLTLESRFHPRLERLVGGQVHVNQLIEVSGENFLRPEEGTTWALVERGSVRYSNSRQRDIAGTRIALVWNGSRTSAYLPIAPAVFGVEVAEFDADLRFENQLSTGVRFEGNRQDGFNGSILQSYIAALTPERGSRGQRIQMSGRGFVATSTDDGYGMLLRYEGTFTPSDRSQAVLQLTGAHALERVPDKVEREDSLEQSVWYAIQGRTLSGFGAQPGVFRGTITPLLVDAFGEQEGLAWQGDFTILSTKQVVYLKYLPAFSKGLEKYGLENVEREIRDRILEVVRRDYAGVNVRFGEDEPRDFIEFSTIELGGPDPSGNDAFGYDNTFNDDAKDTGNLYLSDYLGGLNAQSGAEFNNPYGGIFIESFSNFSPTLSPDTAYSSPEFDRILKPFMPLLAGRPVRATEWPAGARTEAIREAIWMVGNVVANTVSHEIGHSLGLTFYPEDWNQPTNVFHNSIPGDCIMDSGQDRSFEERAELGGRQPARFNERNLQYLKQILPLTD